MYPATKFVRIEARDCIQGYPDANLPTVLLYIEGKCVKSLLGLAPFGGLGTGPERVALTLNLHGNVCGDAAEETGRQVARMAERAIEEREAAEDEDSDFD
jgi:hypothetical protein